MNHYCPKTPTQQPPPAAEKNPPILRYIAAFQGRLSSVRRCWPLSARC